MFHVFVFLFRWVVLLYSWLEGFAFHCASVMVVTVYELVFVLAETRNLALQ